MPYLRYAPEIERPEPDEQARRLAVARQELLTKPAGSLGRLEELGVWAASRQGTCPPRQFDRARAVVFAGDHGVAGRGVSAYPAEVTVNGLGVAAKPPSVVDGDTA